MSSRSIIHFYILDVFSTRVRIGASLDPELQRRVKNVYIHKIGSSSNTVYNWDPKTLDVLDNNEIAHTIELRAHDQSTLKSDTLTIEGIIVFEDNSLKDFNSPVKLDVPKPFKPRVVHTEIPTIIVTKIGEDGVIYTSNELKIMVKNEGAVDTFDINYLRTAVFADENCKNKVSCNIIISKISPDRVLLVSTPRELKATVKLIDPSCLQSLFPNPIYVKVFTVNEPEEFNLYKFDFSSIKNLPKPILKYLPLIKNYFTEGLIENAKTVEHDYNITCLQLRIHLPPISKVVDKVLNRVHKEISELLISEVVVNLSKMNIISLSSQERGYSPLISPNEILLNLKDPQFPITIKPQNGNLYPNDALEIYIPYTVKGHIIDDNAQAHEFLFEDTLIIKHELEGYRRPYHVVVLHNKGKLSGHIDYQSNRLTTTNPLVIQVSNKGDREYNITPDDFVVFAFKDEYQTDLLGKVIVISFAIGDVQRFETKNLIIPAQKTVKLALNLKFDPKVVEEIRNKQLKQIYLRISTMHDTKLSTIYKIKIAEDG